MGLPPDQENRLLRSERSLPLVVGSNGKVDRIGPGCTNPQSFNNYVHPGDRLLNTAGRGRKLATNDDRGPDLAGANLRFLPAAGAASFQGGGDSVGEGQSPVQVA